MRRSSHARITLSLVVALLAGCGGGGSGGGASGAAVNAPPQPAFTVTPTDGAAPLSVTFDGSSSNDDDGTIVTYTWSFGDSSNGAVGSRASHVYSDSGSFAARLTVTDNRGAAASRTVTINVTPASGSFTLSGRIQILPSSAVDSDVNDPSVPLVRNNSFAEAQVLPNPVSLGGYLNLPAQGTQGALRDIGDVTDKFRISFAGSENVLLSVTNPNVDVSMVLLDENQTVVDATVVTGASGSLAVPAAGDYFIEVDILNGATTYVLNVGQNVPASSHALPARVSDEFVPGEVIVQSGDPSDAAIHRGPDNWHRRLWCYSTSRRSTLPNCVRKTREARTRCSIRTCLASS